MQFKISPKTSSVILTGSAISKSKVIFYWNKKKKTVDINFWNSCEFHKSECWFNWFAFIGVIWIINNLNTDKKVGFLLLLGFKFISILIWFIAGTINNSNPFYKIAKRLYKNFVALRQSRRFLALSLINPTILTSPSSPSKTSKAASLIISKSKNSSPLY